MADSNVAEPRYINETIERFDYLLSDKNSPIVSNVLGLPDSTLLDYDEFVENGCDESMLQKYIVQGRKLTEIYSQLDNIDLVV